MERGARRTHSVEIEDKDLAVFAEDFDWLAGIRALVEMVEARVSIVMVVSHGKMPRYEYSIREFPNRVK